MNLFLKKQRRIGLVGLEARPIRNDMGREERREEGYRVLRVLRVQI